MPVHFCKSYISTCFSQNFKKSKRIFAFIGEKKMRLAIRTCFAVSPYAPQGGAGLPWPGSWGPEGECESLRRFPAQVRLPAPPPPSSPGPGHSPVHFAHGRTAGQLPRVLGLSHLSLMLTRLAVALVPGGTALALWSSHSLQNSAHPRPDFFSRTSVSQPQGQGPGPICGPGGP